jgi:hypothetical protein
MSFSQSYINFDANGARLSGGKAVGKLLKTRSVSAEQTEAILAVMAKINAANETVKRTRLHRSSAVFLASGQRARGY